MYNNDVLLYNRCVTIHRWQLQTISDKEKEWGRCGGWFACCQLLLMIFQHLFCSLFYIGCWIYMHSSIGSSLQRCDVCTDVLLWSSRNYRSLNTWQYGIWNTRCNYFWYVLRGENKLLRPDYNTSSKILLYWCCLLYTSRCV